MIAELDVQKLRRTCDPRVLGCQTSEEMTGPEAMIGQEKAVRALRFGLGIQEQGFNDIIFVVPESYFVAVEFIS